MFRFTGAREGERAFSGRVGMSEQDGKPRRVKVRRFTAERRAAFLEHLRRTGNQSAAAKAVGLNRSSVEQRRKRDAEFAIGCAAAEEEASRRLAGSAGPFDGVDGAGGRELNVIRRGRGGRMQIITSGSKRWSKAVEDGFLAALGMCGNVAAAARAVGFGESCVWRRRRTWPAFERAMDQVLDEAEIRIEYRLAAMGSDIAAAGTGRPDGSEGMGTVTSDCPPEALKFDPDLAFRFLKWREEKRRGRTPRGGRPEKRWTFEESIEHLDKKLKAFGRRREGERLAQGWSKDEEGRMIPPGWVRAKPLDGNGDSH